MDRPSPDPELLKAALAKASPEDIAVALQQANPELLRRLQELAAGAQRPEPAPTVDVPAREDVGAHIGP